MNSLYEIELNDGRMVLVLAGNTQDARNLYESNTRYNHGDIHDTYVVKSVRELKYNMTIGQTQIIIKHAWK